MHNTDCGYAAAVEGVACTCGAQPDENGVVTHTDDCAYVEAKAEVPCKHQHDETCGYVEAKAEVPCTHVCSKESGCVTVVTEGYWTCTAPAAEEVPAQVKAFLDAVAAIPAITPDNAEEVAEYVYGPVSDAYEVLLGTEFMDRADVKEAEATYGQAIADVDAALDIDSTPFVTVQPYDEVFPNGVIGYKENGDQYGNKTVTPGGTASFTTLPERIVGGNYTLPGLYYADQYYYKLKSTNDPNNILSEVNVGLCVSRRADGGTWYGFKTDMVTKEGSSGTATITILLVYYVSELRGQQIQTGEYLTGYFSRELNYTVTVSDSGIAKPYQKPVINSETIANIKNIAKS